jgi:hypothetical protein
MEKDWSFYFNEGISLHKTAKKSLSNPEKRFNNELIFNILSMSMERLLISVLLQNKKMPYSETISGLMRESKEFLNWPEGLAKNVLWLNRFVHLCSLDPSPLKIPTDEELLRVMQIATDVRSLVEEQLVVIE